MGDQKEIDGVGYGATQGGQDSDPPPMPTNALVAFDASEPATVRNAPAALMELAWQARAVSSAITLPSALRGKPGDIVAVMLAGRELGIGPMASTRMVHVIGGQTVIATELKLALARRAGHEIYPLAEGPGWCVAGCLCHPEAGPTGWRMTDDLGADYPGLTGWTNATDIMVESWEGSGNNRRKTEAPLTDKANWRSYMRDMLWNRAASQFMRRHVPGLAGGLYTMEEVNGDSDGD